MVKAQEWFFFHCVAFEILPANHLCYSARNYKGRNVCPAQNKRSEIHE